MTLPPEPLPPIVDDEPIELADLRVVDAVLRRAGCSCTVSDFPCPVHDEPDA